MVQSLIVTKNEYFSRKCCKNFSKFGFQKRFWSLEKSPLDAHPYKRPLHRFLGPDFWPNLAKNSQFR